jgi:hypothetical protein
MKKLLIITIALGLVVACLLRFDLVAKESADETSLAAVERGESSTEKTASALEGPAPESSQSDQKQPLAALRYDGKSFDEWKNEWETELKPERRAEAINAFAAFGANGYGKEAAATIVEVMRGLEMKYSDVQFGEYYDSRKEKLVGNDLIKHGAIAAFRRSPYSAYRIPPDAAVPVLCDEVEGGNRNGWLFAACVLKNLGMEAAPAVPTMIEILRQDPDPEIRAFALTVIAQFVGIPAEVQPVSQPLIPVLVEAMRDGDPNVRLQAIVAIRRYNAEAFRALGSAREEAETLLWQFARDKEDRNARSAAIQALLGFAANPSALAPRLREVLDTEDEEDLAVILDSCRNFLVLAEEFAAALLAAANHERNDIRSRAQMVLHRLNESKRKKATAAF